nr:MAG TPA: hypothetical protein [Caudoviricetes sp.]
MFLCRALRSVFVKTVDEMHTVKNIEHLTHCYYIGQGEK